MSSAIARSDERCILCALRNAAASLRSPSQHRTLHSASRSSHERIRQSASKTASDSGFASRRRGKASRGALFSRLPPTIVFRPAKGEYVDRNSNSGRSLVGGTSTAAASLNARSTDVRYTRTPEERIIVELLQFEQRIDGDEIFSRLELSAAQLKEEYKQFKAEVIDSIENPLGAHGALGKRLLQVSRSRGSLLPLYIKYLFFGQCFTRTLPPHSVLLEEQRSVNMRHPQESYPATRRTKREWHLHVGPTNSGKTYHALKRLEEARTGIYAGPLRLLAHEVYLRLNAKGRHTNLVTGDDRRTPSGREGPCLMNSCTVEMVPTNTTVDVAVIDEIQMLGSEDRGWAWTQALLGVKAKELHMCGEERAVDIVQQLAALCGEPCHIHRYERLSPLRMAKESLRQNIKDLRKGDCIVAFSVVTIHSLRQAIERQTGKKCAIIYGSLPPETRAQQAKLFNDLDNDYDILVASNAIGMGLNLSIKRLIFQSVWVNFGKESMERIPISDIKQIAGRAGRFRTAEQGMKADIDRVTVSTSPPQTSVGEVTTLEPDDFDYVSTALRSDVEPIKAAGIQPQAATIERFARYFPPETPFSYIYLRLCENSSTTSTFFICNFAQILSIADAIEQVRDLSIAQRMVFCSSPVQPNKPGEAELAQEMARCVAERRAITMVDLECLDFSVLHDDEQARLPSLRLHELKQRLIQLERLHKAVNVYMWLSYRFVLVFQDRALAQHIKGMVETAIEETLDRMSNDYESIQQKRTRKLKTLLAQMEVDEETGGEAANLDAAGPTSTTHLEQPGQDLNRYPFRVTQDENTSDLQGPPPP